MFVLRELKNVNCDKELQSIGLDSSYRLRAQSKMDIRLLKIYSLTPAQANILKQTAISVGADCLTHREVITGKVEKSDVILTANTAELRKIVQKLVFQPLRLKTLAEQILAACEIREKSDTKLVGVLNITDNSFSDGGMYLDKDAAIRRLNILIDEGADMIDIGAESTKPNSSPVPASLQLERLLPIVDYIQRENICIPISIDTRSSEVAQEVLKRGEYIINDVSGLEYDDKMLEVLVENNAKLILQHSLGNPLVMQQNPNYRDVVEEIYLWFRDKLNYLRTAGVKDVIIDPGIGFGKTKAHNLEILSRIEEFYGLGCEVMVGTSRKSFLSVESDDNVLKDELTLAVNSRLIERGVDYLRVHNVRLHREFMKIFY